MTQSQRGLGDRRSDVGTRANTAVDTACFEAFFRTHYSRLVRALCFIGPDPESAADAAQEALYRLHLRWDRFAEDDDRLRWVYRVAINRCKDYRRYMARIARLFEGQDELVERRVDWYPEREFMEALKGLPPRQRSAAALHYVAGLSQWEVAATMGISEGAVKSHLYRAREALGARLGVER